MRVAETRAVNRALRKAYGIGICSVEEIGVFPARSRSEANVRKLPPQPVNGNGGPKLRDQLCLLIRRHGLDASLVKQYAAEFCGTTNIRQANREQIQSFITHLAELASKDREGLLCTLNSYPSEPQEGAEEVDDKALLGLSGVLKISHSVVNGLSMMNLDAFAPAAAWAGLGPQPHINRDTAQKVAS